jgi:TOBE domain-containing protein
VELRAGHDGGANSFSGKIEARMFLGDAVVYWVRVAETRLLVKTNLNDFAVGCPVAVVMPSERWVAFGEERGGPEVQGESGPGDSNVK